MMGKNQWVVRHGDGWAQRGEGNSRVTRSFDTQRQAIDSARETARREGRSCSSRTSRARSASGTATATTRIPRRGDAIMELSARQLRTGIRSPAILARQLRAEFIAPIDPDTPRSPQRPWIDASIRRYQEGGRKPAVLMADYAERTGRGKAARDGRERD